MGKLVKHEGGCSIDRLSCLPDSILFHILSFLPTRHAVRTSILSTRWRYLYTSVATLDFVLNADVHESLKGFMNFVDKVLFFHDSSCIERFRLFCNDVQLQDNVVDFTGRVCGWISFALWRSVQELHLDFCMSHVGDPSAILPVTLFTSKTLVKFILWAGPTFEGIGFVMTVPTKVCFPSLKTLHLVCLDFVDDESFQRLISGCLVLEELSIVSGNWQNLSEINISNPYLKSLTMEHHTLDYEAVPHLNLVINAPKLVYLKLLFIGAKSYFLANLHSLVNAHLQDLFIRDFNQEAAANLLKGINNVQSLYVTADILRLYTFYNKPKPLPVFQNLVQLEIDDDHIEQPRIDWEEIDLAGFLASSPNLETLIFDTGGFLPSQKTLSCHLSDHLRVIEMNSCDQNNIDESFVTLVEYLLKNASGLEKLKIIMELQAIEQFDEIAKQVLMLPRESKICQVEIV